MVSLSNLVSHLGNHPKKPVIIILERLPSVVWISPENTVAFWGRDIQGVFLVFIEKGDVIPTHCP